MAVGAVDREAFWARVDDAVVVIFALVTEAVVRATAALLDQDVDLAKAVIADDKVIDDRCEEVTGFVGEALTSAGSESDELEDLVAIIQIVPELERSADLAEHIAQRTLQGLGGVITPRSRGLIQSMGDAAERMWVTAADAYKRRSREAAFQLVDDDDTLDDLATELVDSAVASGAEPQVAVDLALIARFYERLGDHAVNLARRVDSMAAPRRLSPARMWARRPHPVDAAPIGDTGRRWWGRLRGLKLVPDDEGFFTLFGDAAVNAQTCAGELRTLIRSLPEVNEHYEAVKEAEHRGDELTVALLRRLDASFVTPFDREDIHALTEVLDDVVDKMFAAASMIRLVGLAEPLPEMNELADVLVAMSEEMVALVGCLRKREGARVRLQRIEHLERQGDVVFRHGMERLFSGAYEALDVVKWKDVVQALEDSLNAIEDVSDVVESILVKTS